MRRQIIGLNAADRCAGDQVPDGIFLVQVQRVYFRRQAQKPYYTLTLAVLEPSRFFRPYPFEPDLLQPEGTVEAELVLARLWVRHRTAWAG